VRTAVIVAVETVSSAAVRQQRATTVRPMSMNNGSSDCTVLIMYSEVYRRTNTLHSMSIAHCVHLRRHGAQVDEDSHWVNDALQHAHKATQYEVGLCAL
jgi:hypothetical protein